MFEQDRLFVENDPPQIQQLELLIERVRWNLSGRTR
jgi:hypothetical protein